MKKLAVGILFGLALAVAPARALPLFAHALKGIVRSIDRETQRLKIEPGTKDGVTEFAVVDGRTRLRRDKKVVTLTDLTVGQTVRLYYKREAEHLIITEMEWISAPATGK